MKFAQITHFSDNYFFKIKFGNILGVELLDEIEGKSKKRKEITHIRVTITRQVMIDMSGGHLHFYFSICLF